jgi:hypothetical protein
MKTITLNLNPKQARLVKAALEQEIRRGSTTFLSDRDVITLGRIMNDLGLVQTERMESK